MKSERKSKGKLYNPKKTKKWRETVTEFLGIGAGSFTYNSGANSRKWLVQTGRRRGRKGRETARARISGNSFA